MVVVSLVGCLTAHLSTHLFVRLSVYLYVCLFVRLSVCSFVLPSFDSTVARLCRRA